MTDHDKNTPSDDSKKLASPAERTKYRADIFTEGIKQVILVNGGGAVALLAFLQAVWKKEPALARVVLTGVGFMALGVAVALLIPFVRVLHSRRAQEIEMKHPGTDSRTWLWFVYNVCAYASIVLFAVGCFWLVFGAFSILPK